MSACLHRCGVFFVVGLALALVASPGLADELLVGAGQPYATIDAAITAAIAGDVITVMDAVHTEYGIWVNKSVTIQGQGADATIVQAHANPNTAAFRVFSIDSSAIVTIRDMTIRHGDYTDLGGGIESAGTLTLERVVLTENRAGKSSTAAYGGGLLVTGPTTIVDCVISNNTASGGVQGSGAGYRGYGGGVYVAGYTTLTAVRTTFSGNTAVGGDGAANVGGEAKGGALGNVNSTVNLDSCLFTGNQALGGVGDGERGGHAYGGAIYNDDVTGPLTVTNSTFSGNSATGGAGTTQGEGTGGAMRGHTGSFKSCTIAANQVAGSVTQGGGIHTDTASAGQGPTFTSCILADNTGPDPADGPDLWGNAQSGDHNVIETTDGYNLVNDSKADVTGIDPNLAPLADNGGATWTHALQSPSQAIDLVPSGASGCTPDVSVDQRAYARAGGPGAGGTACDAGAFEYDSMVTLIFSDGFESGDMSGW